MFLKYLKRGRAGNQDTRHKYGSIGEMESFKSILKSDKDQVRLGDKRYDSLPKLQHHKHESDMDFLSSTYSKPA